LTTAKPGLLDAWAGAAQADAENLPFTDDRFDIVYSNVGHSGNWTPRRQCTIPERRCWGCVRLTPSARFST